MRTRFIHSNFVLDLTGQEVSWTEENPIFTGEHFSKISFPFEMDFKEAGPLAVLWHKNASNVPTEYEGLLESNNLVEPATMYVEEAAEKLKITIKVDGGELPNWNTPINKLDLGTLDTPETGQPDEPLYLINDMLDMSYPNANYNFPMVIAKGYEDNPAYEDFNGLYNYRRWWVVDEVESDGIWAFEGNYTTLIGTDDEPFLMPKGHNANIIKPFPYFLFVLKKAIEANGYTLQGDVLNDPDLVQAMILPVKKYRVESYGEPTEFVLDHNYRTNWYHQNDQYHIEYTLDFNIDKYGDYTFAFFPETGGTFEYFKITQDGNIIYDNTEPPNNYMVVSTLLEGSQIKVEFGRIYNVWGNDGVTLAVGLNTLYDENGDKIQNTGPFQYYNGAQNPWSSIDIAKYLPDVTVGDLIDFLKALKNYNLEVDQYNKVATINFATTKLTESPDLDLSEYEEEFPIRKFSKDKRFLIKFDGDYDDHEFKEVFIDKDGPQLWTEESGELPEGTKQIAIKGIPLPMDTHRGILTAKQLTDSADVLQLVNYGGLTEEKNVTTTMESIADTEELYENYHSKWLEFLIFSFEITFNIVGLSQWFYKLSKTSKVFAYNLMIYVKTLNRTKKNDIEQIEIEGVVGKS